MITQRAAWLQICIVLATLQSIIADVSAMPIQYHVEGHIKSLEPPIHFPFHEGQRLTGSFEVEEEWFSPNFTGVTLNCVQCGELIIEGVGAAQQINAIMFDFDGTVGIVPALIDWEFVQETAPVPQIFRVNFDTGTFLAGIYRPGHGIIDVGGSLEAILSLESVHVVPEPSTLPLLSIGLIGFVYVRRRARCGSW